MMKRPSASTLKHRLNFCICFEIDDINLCFLQQKSVSVKCKLHALSGSSKSLCQVTRRHNDIYLKIIPVVNHHLPDNQIVMKLFKKIYLAIIFGLSGILA